jgi:ribosome-binding factor A
MAKRTGHREQVVPQSQRQLRVGEALRHGLAELLGAGRLRDPALRDVSITVSEVRMSPDLRRASVFVMPLGGAGRDDVIEGLRRAAPHLRSQLVKLVRLRLAPELEFVLDNSFDQAARIDALLHERESDDPN